MQERGCARLTQEDRLPLFSYSDVSFDIASTPSPISVNSLLTESLNSLNPTMKSNVIAFCEAVFGCDVQHSAEKIRAVGGSHCTVYAVYA